MSWLYSPLLPGAAQQESGAASGDAVGFAAGTGTATGQAAAVASTVINAAGIGAVTGQAASIAASVFSLAGSATVAAVGEIAPDEAVAFAAGSGTVAATGASVASAVVFIDGVGTASGATTVVASVVVSISGIAQLQGVGASDGDAPQEEAPAEQPLSASGGAALLHPDLAMPRKKRKPRIIRLGEAEGSQISAEAQAEADFRILWESVRIRDNPCRLEAVVQKRAAMLADLEQATLIRKIG